MGCTFLGGAIRHNAYGMIYSSAQGNFYEALGLANIVVEFVEVEHAQAEAASEALENWANGITPDLLPVPLSISAAAREPHTTVDVLRNWERNHLIMVPRNPENGYRLYDAPELERLRIIRMLIRSRYSVMVVLRMLTQLDQGLAKDLRMVLDTPHPGEDVLSANDRWLSALDRIEGHARNVIQILKEMVSKISSSPYENKQL
jgi:DNA-binding transcriptional MerR regulator